MFKSFEELKHPPDFRVRYKFYGENEGGRKLLPYQGYRSDFWYEHEGHTTTHIFMIWPEFENARGEIILEDDKSVPSSGTARMLIIAAKMKEYHKNKITIGTKGFFMEGERKVAECEVLELLGLNTNPIE